jgi:hypothetical protein
MFEISIGSYKINVVQVVIVAFLLNVIFGSLFCGCAKSETVEGFRSLFSSVSSDYKLGDNTPVDTSSWRQPDLSVKKNADVMNERPEQPIPLPEGQLSMFANTEFKPECCPNAYSNGSGCACMTVKQFEYVKQRGGNNVPYSEY